MTSPVIRRSLRLAQRDRRGGSDGFAIGGGDVSPGIWSIHGKVEKLYHGKIIFVNVYYVYASVVLGNRE
jgi:hypothetical protein